MLWAIDPDTKASGAARFCNNRDLDWVGWVEPFRVDILHWGWQPGSSVHLAIEKPKIYPGVPGIDANDLVDLGEVVGWFRCEIPHTTYSQHYPGDWKGQVSKPVHHDRIWQVLSPQERLLFPIGTAEKIQKWLAIPEKKQKNIKDPVLELLDAAALGLFHLKRVARGGTRYRP